MGIDTSISDDFEDYFDVPKAAVVEEKPKKEKEDAHYELHYEISAEAGMIALGAALIAVSVIKLLSR